MCFLHHSYAPVKNGIFREDLYYRLQVYTIHLKPLRERPEDIPELVQYFIDRYRTKMNKPIEGIHPQALELLMQYAWPGNVRELENAIERAMVVTKEKRLLREDFFLNHGGEKLEYSTDLSVENVEKAHILRQQFDPVLEFVQQTRFAHPSFSKNGHHLTFPLLDSC